MFKKGPILTQNLILELHWYVACFIGMHFFFHGEVNIIFYFIFTLFCLPTSLVFNNNVLLPIQMILDASHNGGNHKLTP